MEKTIDIFERIHPTAKGLLLFDNAPSHRKDSLDVNTGKHSSMRDTIWDGSLQRMVYGDERSKGIKIVLMERGVDTCTKGMKAKDMIKRHATKL